MSVFVCVLRVFRVIGNEFEEIFSPNNLLGFESVGPGKVHEASSVFIACVNFKRIPFAVSFILSAELR